MATANISRFKTLLGAIIVPAAAGFGAVYVMARGADNATTHTPLLPSKVVIAQATPPDRASLAQGDMIKFVFRKEPEPLADITFVDAAGTPRSLKDFAGRTVLLNVWATWCIPCRKEMPGLDRLQQQLGSDRFEVVALSIDRAGIDASKAFLNSIKIANLKFYADPTAKMSAALKVIGMPTTILIDAKGREIGRLIGDAEWDSADAKRLIEAAIQ